MYSTDNKMLTLNVYLHISEATIHELEAYPHYMYIQYTLQCTLCDHELDVH